MNRTKKILRYLYKGITNCIFIIAIIVFVNAIGSLCLGKIPSILNYNFFIVQTGSMEETIHVDDLIVSKKTNINNVKENDIITFICIDPTLPVSGQVITHRVIEINTDSEGLYLKTKGDNNVVADTYYVRADNFVGIVKGKSTFLGKIISFVSKGNSIFIFLLAIVFLGFIMINEIKKYLIEKQKVKEEERKEKLKNELLLEIKNEGIIDVVENEKKGDDENGQEGNS